MPPAMATSKVSLRELADLAIGTPEVGAVNFTALHTLIVAMLKNLQLQDTLVDFYSLSPQQSRSFEAPRSLRSASQASVPKETVSKDRRKSSVARTPAQTLESQVKDLGGQVQDLNRQFKTMDSQVQGILTHMQHLSGLEVDTQKWLGEQEMATLMPGMATPMPGVATSMPEVATPMSEMATPMPRMATSMPDVAKLMPKEAKHMPGVDTLMPRMDTLMPGMDTLMPGMDTLMPGVAPSMPEVAKPMPGMATPVPEKARLGLLKIRKDGPPAMELLQNVMGEVKTLKEDQEKTQEKVQEFLELSPQKLMQRIEEVEKKLSNREELLEQLNRKVSVMHVGEEVTMVTWEDLEQAITDGWKASQGGSESSIGLHKHKRQGSLTPSDMPPSTITTQTSSLDQTLQFGSGLGSDQTSPGPSRTGHPSEGVLSREHSRVAPAAGFPSREQLPRVRDEAGLAKPHHLPVPHFKREIDHQKPREHHGLPHLRRDEQDALPGPVQQDLPSARDGHHYVSPGPHGGMPVTPGLIHVGPDLDQPALLYPTTYPDGMVPLSMGQLGVMTPRMDEQGLVLPGMGQVTPLVPGRDQQRLELPSADQPGMVPLSPYQYSVGLPGTQWRGVEQPGIDESGAGPLGIDQPGFARFLMDQQGLAPPFTDQQALVQPSLETPGFMQATWQHGMVQPGPDQRGMVQPGTVQPDGPSVVQPGTEQPVFVQPGTGQPGLVQAGMDQRGLVQPGIDQRGLVQPGMDQQGLVQPSMDRRGLMQPGMDQQGLVQPSMDRRGLVQPGMDQRGLVQPGMDQRGLVQPGMDQRGLVQPGMDQRGLVQPGMDQRGLVQPGMDQRGLVQPGMDQRGLVQPGMDQRGLVQPGMDQRGLVQPGMDQRGLVQPGMDQRGLVQPGMDHRGLVQPGMDQRGLVQPGMDQRGLVQPGMDQRGLVQPGMDQRGLVQPGMDQRGLVQPGMDQRGLMQPGMDQPGLVQPGMDQPGLVQPGMDQPGLVQPGMDQRGLVQPGMDQRGLVQPGMDQRGLVQPGMDQRGLVQPGMDQRGLVQPGMDQRGLVQPGMDQRGLVQPGMDQRGLVQPGMDQRGLVQPGMDQRGLVQPGMDQRGLVQPGMDQRGLVQPGMDQPGLVQPGMDQPGLVQPGIDQPGLVQPGIDQPGLVQPGMDQPGLVQPGMDQRGLVQPGMDQRGLVQPGMDQRGLVQPGMDQPGLVQPGMDQPGLVQPGMDQRGLVQPGMDQRGLVQPGTGWPGLMQPSAGQRGLVQPGIYPRGFFQPGMYPAGLVPPGAYPRGLVVPGMYPHGWRQPAAYQRGLVPSGTEVQGFPTFHTDSRSFISPHPYQHGLVLPGRDQHGQVSPLLDKQVLTPTGRDQEGLVPIETYQQSLMPSDTEQRGPAPLGTDQHGPAPLGTDQRGPIPLGTDQRGPIPLGTDQRGPIPLGTGVQSALSSQQLFILPGPYQYGQAYLSADQRDSRGLRGSGYPGVDQYIQVDSDRKQSDISIEMTSSQEATSLSTDSQVSPEKTDTQSERHDSLDKLAPSFPTAVETFRLVGELIGLYVELKENMKELDEEKAGQTELEKIQYLLSVMVQKTIPPDLQEQLKTIKTLAKDVRQERAKLERIQRLLEEEGHQDLGKEMKAGHLGLQLGILRVTVADIEKELSELRDSQEQGKVSMEHSVSEASLYLQDQLDKLRTIIENMLASSSRLLSLSMAPQKTLTTLTPGEIRPEATCPACSLDLSHQVSMLVQRYEQLQDLVNNLAASRPSKKAKLQSQDEELLGHVQSAILQVQGDCEKLNITTSNLIEDHQQKQKDIAVLYQGLEKLQKEKANREHLEMEIDVKADKSALASKVSRVQFDATTEQLNRMMQELVAKMSGQEQDWQKMLDKLLAEMDSKLDRLELDPVKQLLEDRWKSLRQQLRERSPLYQADEAAAMRRQLLAHFHCLSCDRPLETAVTGQIIPVTPVGPSLPGHRSARPYTIFELEQVRQQSRSLKPGGPALRGAELAQTERSVGRLRTMHSKMLMDIEKVQIHFGGSVKASSQMIRELLQAQCLSHPCYKRVPEVANYTYWTVPRRCGGSHTLTYPYRRSRPQHLPQALYPHEEVQTAMKHDEVDILGLDGHIYKGRMDKRLPGIANKDSLRPTKHKARTARPHAQRPQSRPQSAQMLAGSAPAPSHQWTDRPVSSQGRLAQTSVAHPSSPETAAELGLPMDMPPGEGLEEPTRGPRSTTAP